MKIKKNNINHIVVIFLFSHLLIWTLIPSLSNINLPLDTIEALAWGNEFKLGYSKHPPLSAWFVEFFYKIFGNQDWAYYLLSQTFVVFSFYIIFKFAEDFFKDPIYSLLSILLLEGIYFYNFTSPEFNVNVCLLPFWSLTVFYCWRAFKQDDIKSWVLLGIFSALGILSKYLFIYLLLSLDIFFIYVIIKKKLSFKSLISLFVFCLLLLPHLVWLVNNDYMTIQYGIFRSVDDPLSSFGNYMLLDNIVYPFIFLAKQILIVLPFFVMFFFIISKFKFKLNHKDERLIFLLIITFAPIILMFFTSLISGARIRTMGMMPFYLFFAVTLIYIFKKQINLNKLKNLLSAFIIIFFLSPTAYYISSITKKNERTDYPGKEISKLIQKKWDNNFSDEIKLVVGYGWIYGWYAQNLSYHLESRPKWREELKQEKNLGTIWIKGFNEITDCDGVLYQIESYNDVCMIGKK